MTENRAHNRELKIINKKSLKNSSRALTYTVLGILGGFSLTINPNVNFSGNPIINEYKQNNNLLAQFKRELEDYNITVPDGLPTKTREEFYNYLDNNKRELGLLVTGSRQDSLNLASIVRPYTRFEEKLDKESNTYEQIGGSLIFSSFIGYLGILTFLGRKNRRAKEQLKQKYHSLRKETHTGFSL